MCSVLLPLHISKRSRTLKKMNFLMNFLCRMSPIIAVSISGNPRFKGCLSLSNYSVDMSPMLMSPFLCQKNMFLKEKDRFFRQKVDSYGWGTHL